jgi:type IV secretion system protein VirB9
VWHILVKPTDIDLNTTLVVMTDRRTYRMQLTSTDSTYLASVCWEYPNSDFSIGTDGLGLNSNSSAPPPTDPTEYAMNLNQLNTQYSLELIKGQRPDWYPLTVFSDGAHTFIQMPPNLSSSFPVLLVSTNASADHHDVVNDPSYSSMVNYRVKGNYIIVDKVIRSAILQSGVDKDEDSSDTKTIVWIHQS